MVRDAPRGLIDEPWPAQLKSLVWEKRRRMTTTTTTTDDRNAADDDDDDGSSSSTSIPTGPLHPLVLSIGQVV